ncbi:HAD family hydrolase [Jiangella aurantiaca]|uniref:HAD family hydrolase n=1 Tax=Jiangella aurantiaca TaxID=2530373 RepID=A0A4R4ZYV9_9ACTN|nr:HAD hydrolase-like protein [Jiangella aurantiaca]TDD64503.1 HAD family hydrolase [Jiangella aurantiaca]
MTPATNQQLAELMSGVELVMLDFDGPICSVFAGLPAPVVAERLRTSLRGLGVSMSLELERDEDPLSIYRRSATFGPAITAQVYEHLVAAEIEAVGSAEPTAGATEVIYAAQAGGRRVAIVSNNSATAVESYIKRHNLASFIDHVAARRAPDPTLMKPSPAYLVEAGTALGVPADESALVGDSVTDIEAALYARVHAIGYANKAGKHERLLAAGAEAVISTMTDLVHLLN